ncbi:MAG: hypothetical protein Q9170_007665 [Blastenia crenularia]
MRLSIVRDIIWTYPWTVMLINFLIVQPSCTSTSLRRWTVADDLCAGTLLTPRNEDQWFLDLWTPTKMLVNQSADIDPYIEAFMIGGMQLDGIASQLRDQASKASTIALAHGIDEMTPGLDQLAEKVAELAVSHDQFSYVFFLERDLIIHRFRSFVGTYALAMDRTEALSLSPWEIVLPLTWMLPAANQHAHSPWLPQARTYTHQVRAEVQFQAKRFLVDSIAAVERVRAAYATMERVLGSQSHTLIGPAMNVVKWHQENLNDTISALENNATMFELAPWCQYDWYYKMPGCSSEKVQQGKTLRDHFARGERILTTLELLLEATSTYPGHVAKLRDDLDHLGVRLSHITTLDLMSEGFLMLPPIKHDRINSPEFIWLRPDWAPTLSVPQYGTTTSRNFSYNLHQVGNSTASIRLSGIARLCQMPINRDMVHGGLHLICNFWSFARTFSPPGGDPLDGVQRSWLQKRDGAIRRYRKKLHADDRSMTQRVLAAFDLHVRGKKVPEYLD